MTTRTVIPDGYMEKRQEGRSEAILFFQSLLDPDEALNKDIVGDAFSGVVIDEVLSLIRSKNAMLGIGRLSGFLSTVGEMLWEIAEEKRALIRQVESKASARQEPCRTRGHNTANVIRFVLVDAEERRPDVD